ncbi:unnamed protein product [Darwinula stevensoni]|uniref:SGNH hydrolase-type esterase domain-containing protein n=1 Tax=Darwinula stevensoni TaxID=69355 RepID=A0A7R9AGP9_9CRUS|nr:unnamed protein product [Darwinula stevensoni]CAG0903931.1 unnamed protein product [Darwinula stevensoni]
MPVRDNLSFVPFLQFAISVATATCDGLGESGTASSPPSRVLCSLRSLMETQSPSSSRTTPILKKRQKTLVVVGDSIFRSIIPFLRVPTNTHVRKIADIRAAFPCFHPNNATSHLQVLRSLGGATLQDLTEVVKDLNADSTTIAVVIGTGTNDLSKTLRKLKPGDRRASPESRKERGRMLASAFDDADSKFELDLADLLHAAREKWKASVPLVFVPPLPRHDRRDLLRETKSLVIRARRVTQRVAKRFENVHFCSNSACIEEIDAEETGFQRRGTRSNEVESRSNEVERGR